ncbi:MAG: hypothetical protein ACREJ3_20465 [Polyangiaceae bacterium]
MYDITVQVPIDEAELDVGAGPIALDPELLPLPEPLLDPLPEPLPLPLDDGPPPSSPPEPEPVELEPPPEPEPVELEPPLEPEPDEFEPLEFDMLKPLEPPEFCRPLLPRTPPGFVVEPPLHAPHARAARHGTRDRIEM